MLRKFIKKLKKKDKKISKLSQEINQIRQLNSQKLQAIEKSSSETEAHLNKLLDQGAFYLPFHELIYDSQGKIRPESISELIMRHLKIRAIPVETTYCRVVYNLAHNNIQVIYKRSDSGMFEIDFSGVVDIIRKC